MTTRAIRGMAMALALLALTAWSGAEAAEIKLLSTVGMLPATPDLIAQFERETGHKIVVTYGLAAVLKQNFLDGTAADRTPAGAPSPSTPMTDARRSLPSVSTLLETSGIRELLEHTPRFVRPHGSNLEQ